ncbi:hypothetical protein LZ30DRAFT_456773 [Colletotrichum cereale]|nr:hypothetical protein LZ30DRAFT_456773 [Colletotrichum cereale]
MSHNTHTHTERERERDPYTLFFPSLSLPVWSVTLVVSVLSCPVLGVDGWGHWRGCQLLWRRPIGAIVAESTFPDLDGVGESLGPRFHPPHRLLHFPASIWKETRATFSDASNPTPLHPFLSPPNSVWMNLSASSLTIPKRQNDQSGERGVGVVPHGRPTKKTMRLGLSRQNLVRVPFDTGFEPRALLSPLIGCPLCVHDGLGVYPVIAFWRGPPAPVRRA